MSMVIILREMYVIIKRLF